MVFTLKQRLGFTALKLLVILLIAVFLLYLFLWGTPFQRGFFCNDPSITYPYRPSTVPSVVLVLVSVSAPVLTIVLVETWLKKAGHHVENDTLAKHVAHIFVVSVGFAFGALSTQLLTDLTKATVGRLRPNFLDVCRPNFTEIDCGTDMRPHYVQDYTCYGNAQVFGAGADITSYVNKSRLSFPSGHASMSFQAMFFIVFYLQARICRLGTTFGSMVVPFIQLFCLSVCTFTALSRIMDNKHHAGDVLAGSILGTVIQLVNVKYIMRLFDGEVVAKRNLAFTASAESDRFRQSTATQIDVVDQNS